MKSFTVTLLSAFTLSLFAGTTSPAKAQAALDTNSPAVSDSSAPAKVSTVTKSRSGWNNNADQSGDISLSGTLDERLNRLVLDDNLRALRMSVHSDFTRNTPSFKKIENLVAVLANRNLEPPDRWKAAQTLGESKRVVAVLAVPALIQSLHGDPDITVRSYAAIALVKLDIRSAVPQLVHGLESNDPDVRQLSAAALHSAGSDAARILSRLVRCDDPHMKSLGCLALAEVGAPASTSLTALREAASEADPGSTFTRAAEESIARIKNASSQTIVAQMPFDAQKWKGDERDLYRPSMVDYVVTHEVLLGKNAEQVGNLLGPGISFDGGNQLRYCVGAVGLLPGFQHKKHPLHSAAARAAIEQDAKEAYLVVSLKDNIVQACELKVLTPTDWSLSRQDKFISTENLPKHDDSLSELETISSRL